MTPLSSKRGVRSLAGICVMAMLTACAATGKNVETIIEKRANARWADLFANDVESAYKYLTPGYRSSVSLQQYKRAFENQQVRWTSAKYVESNCEESTCDVEVLVGYTVNGALPGVKSFEGEQYVHETWVLVDRKWYMVPPR